MNAFLICSYSESLYALFSIGGVFHLLSGSKNTAVIWFSLSGLSRSNGMVNAGYICFQTMHHLYEATFVRKHTYVSSIYYVNFFIRMQVSIFFVEHFFKRTMSTIHNNPLLGFGIC